MRLRTKIVFAITSMVVVLVTGFSYIYISQLLRQKVSDTYDECNTLAKLLVFHTREAIPDLSSTRVDVNNPKAVRAALKQYLQLDPNLNNEFNGIVSIWPDVIDASLVDEEGQALLHTNPAMVGKMVPARPDLELLRYAGIRQQFAMILGVAQNYDIRLPVQLNQVPFGSVHIGVRTSFLRKDIEDRLRHAMVLAIGAIFVSLFLSAAVSHVALTPLQRISERIDMLTADSPELPTGEQENHDEYGLVTLKIAHLGRQMQDVKEVFSELKGNLDQIMGNLQDGLVLFTRDWRIVLVSASAERFLERPRSQILARRVGEVFSQHTPLGDLVLESFRQRRPVSQRTVQALGQNIQVSLDFILEGGTQIGALLTMRDTESVRRIEDEIELSRRLAAIGRLTSGVAHEVKNPINAIVLHLENLRHKLPELQPDAKRHIDVIGSEIHRLDRVVQVLVDFTRPVELRLREVDLRRVLEDVVAVAQPEAETLGVSIERDLPSEPVLVSIDSDLIKQAVLNVVINGIQAMPDGGKLRVSLSRRNGFAITAIQDQGPGIPDEMREKIFTLYFTTKKTGSGIGLAMAYRVMQLHHGTVDFRSVQGEGTTFDLSLPLLPERQEALLKSRQQESEDALKDA
jgi:signal transduction histidine kinase